MTQAARHAFARHGGRIDDARRLFPQAPAPWLDLSTGINPRPWTPPASLAVDPGPLPSPRALAELEDAAAACFGTAAAHVVALPGSELGLRLLPMLGLPRPLVAVRPCYGTHADIADQRIGTVEAGKGTLLLANPNNPDGRILPPAELARLAGAQAAAGGWLVVDEAFVDAAPDLTALPLIGAGAPVVVLRSFGKFFGLAGLRLGFLIGPPPVVDRLRALLGDWPVSAEAIAWGRAAYADAAWIASTRQDLATRAGRLDAVLARHGLRARGDCPLFRLADHAEAPAWFERLARAGILTRPFTEHPSWLRFGLPGSDADFARLDRALAGG